MIWAMVGRGQESAVSRRAHTFNRYPRAATGMCLDCRAGTGHRSRRRDARRRGRLPVEGAGVCSGSCSQAPGPATIAPGGRCPARIPAHRSAVSQGRLERQAADRCSGIAVKLDVGDLSMLARWERISLPAISGIGYNQGQFFDM